MSSRISHGREVTAHTRRLGSNEVGFIDGLPCTSLERTVVDCCLMFSVKQAVILVDHASRMGGDRAQLRSQCSALAGRNGVVALRRALELAEYFRLRATADVVFAERRREKALMEAGWTFLRIEWKDLFNEVEFKYRVLQALKRGGAETLAI